MDELERVIKKRVERLQRDWNYWTHPRRFKKVFSKEAREYYESIPTRLNEIEEILRTV